MDPLRPSVSRETRLLLAIIVVSLALLWVLARIRFPGRPATPNPVPPVFAQLASPSAFDDIASTVAQLMPQVGELIDAVVVSTDDGPEPQSSIAQALRVRDGLGMALVGEYDHLRTVEGTPIEIAGRDPITGLTLLRLPGDVTRELETWSSHGAQHPHFLIASDISIEGVSLRPVFIGSLNSVASPSWTGPIWAVPYSAELRPGMFVFTVAGELAGLAVSHDGRVAIVPGDLLLSTIDRLSRLGNRAPMWLGAEVQTLTPTLGRSLQAAAGVVATWVDPGGPAAGLLSPMDVVDHVNGHAVASTEQWRAQVADLSEGDTALLDVRRRGEARQVRVVAGKRIPTADGLELGLTLRTVSGVGAEVLRVLPASAAARAGIQTGDLITRVDDVAAPTSARVSRLFANASQGGSLVVALTRDGDHRVLAIQKQP